MKKVDNKGFVLAETLVVTIFLMTIFTMIYMNFYPLIGEYEKREHYDDVDGKYAVYWLKKIIEDDSYIMPVEKENCFRNKGYARFECSDVAATENDIKRETCINLVKDLEVANCTEKGNLCEIYITKYRLGGPDGSVWFKKTVENNHDLFYQESCVGITCKQNYLDKCQEENESSEEIQKCQERIEKKVFRGGFKDYIETLPDYRVESLNSAKYRVIVSFHHKKDNNHYYSYSTIEVSH